jgi:hypothetical protein
LDFKILYAGFPERTSVFGTFPEKYVFGDKKYVIIHTAARKECEPCHPTAKESRILRK